MIIRYRTTKAPKGQQTAGSGAGAAPLPVVLSALRALVVSLRIIIKIMFMENQELVDKIIECAKTVRRQLYAGYEERV